VNLPTTRPTIYGRHAMVATGHPLASVAALDVLRQGGNAVDAAVCAAGVLTVVLPDMCSPGGDVFALIFQADPGKFFALNGSGAAPLDSDVLSDLGIPDSGPRAATVPAAPAAWAELVERFGRWPLPRLFAPAIEHARNGFPVSQGLARSIADHHWLLERFPSTANVFLPQGRPPQPGEILVQRDLADSLQCIANNDASAAYLGELAERIISGSQSAGGLWTLEDFGRHRSEWAEPLSTTYHGYDVLVPPPVSQGHILLEELNIVEQDDLLELGWNSADLIHLMVESMKLAFASRMRYTGDPAWVVVPTDTLLSKERARERRSLVDPDRAAAGVASPSSLRAHTTYLAVVDTDGNAVSFIQSIFREFGSGFVAGDTGILLNDRATSFSLDTDSPNMLRPGKRPVHTLTPCMVAAEGQPVLLLGTPGGQSQVQVLFQLLINLLDFKSGVQEAVEAPRWRSEAGNLLVESRIPSSVRETLSARGHRVEPVAQWDERTGGVQTIRIDRARGTLHGGADPRREGYALGW
jgi:gamma-glutamyltranspeptidase/glutathione hydrolase